MNKKIKGTRICETGINYKTEHFINYPIIFEQNENGSWTVTCPVLPGCISEGNTKEEAIENIKDAIQLYIRAVKKEMDVIKRKGVEISKVAVGV